MCAELRVVSPTVVLSRTYRVGIGDRAGVMTARTVTAFCVCRALDPVFDNDPLAAGFVYTQSPKVGGLPEIFNPCNLNLKSLSFLRSRKTLFPDKYTSIHMLARISEGSQAPSSAYAPVRHRTSARYGSRD